MSMTTDRRTVLRMLLALAVGRLAPRRAWGVAAAENFQAVYRDQALRERFRPFLDNVFNLFPAERFHQLILEVASRETADERTYREIARRLPDIAPRFGRLRYGLPALATQKAEMSRQVLHFLGDDAVVHGYLEIGSTGRYVSDLQDRISIDGPLFIVNDVAPSYAPGDLLERGGVRKIGTFLPLGNYDPIAPAVESGSLGLVTNFIGLHHCPAARLDGFVRSIHRVLTPGGRLLHRDHDVDGLTLGLMAALAHDVFNVGVGLSWAENRDQLRLFRPIAEWTAYFEARGFRRVAEPQAQPGDPTANLLIELQKV